ncbi:MAG: PRC-barrel domain-containing protein [Armatimonadetes bacterium]|nr:PRC-barrel domain-containing protein [Armatimonadota bacterium]
MLINAKTITGFKLHSLDGDIGSVKEFYFDDDYWGIRYLVVNTGNWLMGTQVLISPKAIDRVDTKAREIGVSLTKKQIEESPPLDSDKPVSRQFEESYHRYYGWPTYWGAPTITGGYPYTMSTPPPEPEKDMPKWDPHLRSTNAVEGYAIEATDGELGNIVDFIVDDETWTIRYLVVDTGSWWPGRKVLIPTRWVDRISWGDAKAYVSINRETIKDSPKYTDQSLLSREYETELYRHYSREGYWLDDKKTASHSSR